MCGRSVELETPARLHFGLLSFGQSTGRQFGGVGVMIARPVVRLRVSQSKTLEANGPSSSRAVDYARRAGRYFGLGEEPRCRIEVIECPPEHVGLGVGTQLGMAVAAGVSKCCTGEVPDNIELARAAGRGRRSAVGVHGFAGGGLIYEAGKTDADEIAPLASRVALPEAWRFVQLRPRESRGLSGDPERLAFEELPPVTPETTATLRHEIETRLLPSVAAGCFDSFSESLYRYGREAGKCFASYQGGPYASPRLASLADAIRGLGIRGVGQSSWGPTLFALLPDEDRAVDLIERLRRLPVADNCHFDIAPPANHGARTWREAAQANAAAKK